MYYYRFDILAITRGNIGVSHGTHLSIIAALPKPYPDDSSEDQKLLELISKKNDKMKTQQFSQIHITEFKKLSEGIFRKRKITITINFEEWH